jgi:hypothetical protein
MVMCPDFHVRQWPERCIGVLRRTAVLIPVDAVHQAFDAARRRPRDFARQPRGVVETYGNA